MLANLLSNIILIVLLVTLAIRIVLLFLIKPVKVKWNTRDYIFEIDPFLGENKFGNETNLLYENLNNNLDFINSYVITKSLNHRSLVVKYNELNNERLNYQVFCYDSKLRLIKVIEINDNTGLSLSKRVKLPVTTSVVNLVEEELGINFEVVKNRKISYLYVVLDFIIAFSFTYKVIDIVISIYTKYLYKAYMEQKGLYMMFIFSLITAITTVIIGRVNRNRNKALRKEVSYE